MPNTNGQTFSPATASGLNRRQIRKHLLDTLEGLSCISRVDGSLDISMKARVHGTQSQAISKVMEAVRSLGFTPKLVGVKSSTEAASHLFSVACSETVSQGLCGAHGYRGEGTFILSGSKLEAYLAPEAQAEAEAEAEAQAEAEAPEAEAPEAEAQAEAPQAPQAPQQSRAALRAICSTLGLSTGGNVATLEARIRAYQEANA